MQNLRTFSCIENSSVWGPLYLDTALSIFFLYLLFAASNDEVCEKYFTCFTNFQTKLNKIESACHIGYRMGWMGRSRLFKIFAQRPLPTSETCDMCGIGYRLLYDTVCDYVGIYVCVRAEVSVKWLRDMKSTCIRIDNEVKNTLVQMKYLQIMDFIIWKLRRNRLCVLVIFSNDCSPAPCAFGRYCKV